MRVMSSRFTCLFLLGLGFLVLSLTLISGNVEGDALHSLRSSLTDPNNVLQSWDPTLVNPCTWFHVTCNPENSVIRVDLGNAALSGQLVPQLGLLKNLEYFDYRVLQEHDQYEEEGLNDSLEDERDLDQIMKDRRAAELELSYICSRGAATGTQLLSKLRKIRAPIIALNDGESRLKDALPYYQQDMDKLPMCKYTCEV